MRFILLTLLLTTVGCAAFGPKTWRDRKRECHSYYMDSFGVNHQGAVELCKEELGRQQ